MQAGKGARCAPHTLSLPTIGKSRGRSQQGRCPRGGVVRHAKRGRLSLSETFRRNGSDGRFLGVCRDIAWLADTDVAEMSGHRDRRGRGRSCASEGFRAPATRDEIPHFLNELRDLHSNNLRRPRDGWPARIIPKLFVPICCMSRKKRHPAMRGEGECRRCTVALRLRQREAHRRPARCHKQARKCASVRVKQRAA